MHYIATSSRRLAPNDAPASTLVDIANRYTEGERGEGGREGGGERREGGREGGPVGGEGREGGRQTSRERRQL